MKSSTRSALKKTDSRSDKKIKMVITGGAGFIGSHLSDNKRLGIQRVAVAIQADGVDVAGSFIVVGQTIRVGSLVSPGYPQGPRSPAT